MSKPVVIHLPEASLHGDLVVPEKAVGLVVFAHGSGSSRRSPRNHFVAERINNEGLATLLMDLLTEEEERQDEVTRELRFDIGLLARRVSQVVEWSKRKTDLGVLNIGLFGSSTGAAAALVAAAETSDVKAVVSRGGRPDLAGAMLSHVKCPTLLIVGGDDDVVLELNREAKAQMSCPAELVVVPGATHLFEEPGALEQVAELAAGWFGRHLAAKK